MGCKINPDILVSFKNIPLSLLPWSNSYLSTPYSAGVNRHFQMVFIHDKLNNSISRKISSKQIWTHLMEMYDLQALVSAPYVMSCSRPAHSFTAELEPPFTYRLTPLCPERCFSYSDVLAVLIYELVYRYIVMYIDCPSPVSFL